MTRTALAALCLLDHRPGMFSGLTPSTNFLLRIALAFGAGLMMAALL